MTAVIEEITDVDPAELDDVFARWLNQVPLLETPSNRRDTCAHLVHGWGSALTPFYSHF